MDGWTGRQADRQAANDGLRPEQAISLSAKRVNEIYRIYGFSTLNPYYSQGQYNTYVHLGHIFHK
jgi:hypothetical protein